MSPPEKHYLDNLEHYGEKVARAEFDEELRAHEQLLSVIQTEEIDCDLQRNGRFTAAWSEADLEYMGREMEAIAADEREHAERLGAADG